MTAIDDVKSRLDIVDLISRYVTLDRSGRRYKAPCPFHQEKTPSFIVYPERQSWHCYGACATGGDVFSFMMRAENLDFGETLRRLADEAGVTLPSPQKQTREKDAYQINEEAKSFYQEILASEKGSGARAYLKDRGINQDSLIKFELGLSPPDGQSLGKHLISRGYSQEQLLDAGVIRMSNRGSARDLFRGRLIIPIRNGQGELGGFGGRAMDDSMPKYLNSARTPVFDKGRILYGLYLAKESAREQGLVVVEGYMDAIMAHQHGFTNAVASMGTALTSDQVAEIRRLTSHVVMALDPDAAGQQATLRSLATSWEVFQKLVTQRNTRDRSRDTIIFQRQDDLDLRVMSLPDQLDPDELIRRSPEEWSRLVEGAVPLFEFLLPAVSQQVDISSPRGKARVVEILFPFIAAVPEPIQQDLYFQQLANHLGIPDATLKASVAKYSQPAAGRRNNSSSSRRTSGNEANQRSPQDTTASPFAQLEKDPVEEYCLALLLKYPEMLPDSQIMPEYFQRPDNRELVNQLMQLASMNLELKGENFNEDLVGRMPSVLHDHLNSLFEKELPPLEPRLRWPALRSVARRLEERFLRELKSAEATWLSEEQTEVLEEPSPQILDINQRLKGIESARSWLELKTTIGR